MHDDRSDQKNAHSGDGRRGRIWQQPKVSKVSIKQITRGGQMPGFDVMGMMGGMMTS